MQLSISTIEEQAVKSSRFSYSLLVLVSFTALIFISSPQKSSIYQNAVKELNLLLSLEDSKLRQLMMNAALENEELNQVYSDINLIFTDYGLSLKPLYPASGRSIINIGPEPPNIYGTPLEVIDEYFTGLSKLSVNFLKVDNHFQESLKNHLKEMHSFYASRTDKNCYIRDNNEKYTVSCGGGTSGFNLMHKYDLETIIIPFDILLAIKIIPEWSILVGEINSDFLFIPNLKQVWDQIRTEAPVQARAILARKDISQERKLEIFGLSIPQNLISWALPTLICALSVHFLIHILHLNRAAKNNADICEYPWLVIMPGRLANIATIFTLVILPITAFGITVRATWSGHMLHMRILIIVLLISTVISLLISIVKILEIKKIKRPNFIARSTFE